MVDPLYSIWACEPRNRIPSYPTGQRGSPCWPSWPCVKQHLSIDPQPLLLATIAFSMPVYYSYILYFKQLTLFIVKRPVFYKHAIFYRQPPQVSSHHGSSSFNMHHFLDLSIGVEHLIRPGHVAPWSVFWIFLGCYSTL